jgi:hypothetical protein
LHYLGLLKPGGKALIIIPNYGVIYGRLQQYFDPENLALHNHKNYDPNGSKKSGSARLG